MKKRLVIVVAALVLILVGVYSYHNTYKSPASKASSKIAAPSPTTAATQSVQLDTSEIHNQINQQRTKAGLKALSVNDKLVDTATSKCEDMKKKNYFTHNSPDGTTYTNFIKARVPSFKLSGENLGAGYTDINQLINDWMQSEQHKTNILNPKFTSEGIAVCGNSNQKPGLIIVVHFIQS
jgi:uncharacterized protein YkwD